MAKSKKSTKKPIRKLTKTTTKRKSSLSKKDGYVGNNLSFKIIRDPMNFMTMKFTQQTMIWTVLVLFIMIIQIWILSLQLEAVKAIDGLR